MRISDWSSDVCSSDLPDVLLCRSEQPLPDSERRKIASFTNVSEKAVISVMDLDNIHKIPMWLHAQGLDQVVAERLRLDDRAAESAALSEWLAVVEAAEYPLDEVTIGIVGKYRSEEHTSELQPLMRISYAVFCLEQIPPLTHTQ